MTQVIEAHVERVIFQNNSGWTVAAITTETGTETAVGVMPGLHTGMDIKAQAEPVTHPQYGDQLKIHSYTTSAPSTAEGMTIFLQKMVWGIGPALAKRIVAKFGRATEDAMSDPAALQTVDGIGEGRAADIAASWTEHESERAALEKILTFLVTNGLTTAYARQIFDLFGFNAGDVIAADPYQLTRVRGIGFSKADKIALALGFTPDCPQRIRAALVYQAGQNTLSGHCYTPRDALLRAVISDLIPGLDYHAAGQHLDAILSEDLPALVQDGPRVYPWKLHKAETEAAERLAILCGAKSKHFLGNYKAGGAIRYTEKQQAAIRAAFEEKISIITGGPGTGKTTLTRAIVNLAQRNDKSIMLMSPTGKAAKRLAEATGCEATTIHRALGSKPGSRDLAHDSNTPWPADLVLVDEVSMLDIRLARDLINAVKPSANLILVGDIDQLPSVGPSNVLRDLIEIGEQTHLVNAGKLPIFHQAGADGDFYLFGASDAGDAADRIVDLVSARIPRAFGIAPQDIQVLTPIHRGDAGDNALNERLQATLNPAVAGNPGLKSYGREFRIGDRVIQTRNDYDRQVFNGDMGRIATLDLEEQVLVVDFDGAYVGYEFSQLDQLEHAYAVSIHKSQGSEFPAVVVPLLTQHYMMLQRNLLYTAITRARELVVLVGSRRAIAIAVNNDKIAHRNTHLRARLQSEKAGKVYTSYD
ncbi:MAG: ATP-dependent RecD-like DNA helicase [Chloroflexi bacterium]|jgi:exodeoxyribonuclease V alpha subunit|nr:ATP-dependent RecD-like DNA helicase [Chloroflexota bacterium]